MREISDSLARAFDRIDDFQAVQRGRDAEALREAVECLQKSVGIRDPERSLLVERLDAIRGSGEARGHVLLGLILGLIAAEEI
ncbi:MAG: hypothetical protein ABI726_09545 [bacterium]